MSIIRRCIVLDDYQNAAFAFADWTRLEDQVAVETVTRHIDDRQELVRRLEQAEIVVANRERTVLDEALFADLPGLRLVITNGRRNAAIDIDAARKRGIVVCGTNGAGNPAAELTWALILAASRHLVDEVNGVSQEAAWQTTVGMGLAGKTLGMLGLGRVGSRVAKVGLSFEMKVLGWSPSLTDERALELGIARAPTLDSVFSGSDVVSLHIPLNASTRGLVGRPQLSAMRPGSILVNTSRYDIVQADALIDILGQGRLRAAFDVFDQEPLPTDHPIRSVPNVLLTPHLGYVTDDNYRRYYTEAVSIIDRWLTGDSLADCAL